MTTPDPFSFIPNTGDDEYEGTVLETGQERRTAQARAEAARCGKALDTASEVCPRCFRQHAWLLEG